jgi:hypothetical protein
MVRLAMEVRVDDELNCLSDVVDELVMLYGGDGAVTREFLDASRSDVWRVPPVAIQELAELSQLYRVFERC